MTRHRREFGAVLAAAVVALSGTVLAQGQQQPPPKPIVPSKVEVVISRFLGDKKTASYPYTLMVNVNGNRINQGRTSIRMGVDVPVGTTTTTRDGVTTTQPSYRNVGTNIDCYADSREDGRFDVFVNILDSSFAGGGDPRSVVGAANPAAFMTFSTSNHLTLRDGQQIQFTMATDKVTGETVKVDVTFTLLK